MNISQQFTLRFYLNQARSQATRTLANLQFQNLKLSIDRFPSIDPKRVKRVRGFETPAYYAHALSTRLLLRTALQSGAEAVLIFDDDVALTSNFLESVNKINLPEDWGIFYFGCQHVVNPGHEAPGIVRVKQATGSYAYAIRRPFIKLVMAAFDAGGIRSCRRQPSTDLILTGLQRDIPSYAAFPNLANKINSSDNVK